MPRWLLKCDTWRQQEPQFLPKSRQRTRRAPVAYPCHSGILSLAPPSQPSRWAGWDRKSPPASGRRLQPHPPQLWALSRPPVTKDISEFKKKKNRSESSSHSPMYLSSWSLSPPTTTLPLDLFRRSISRLQCRGDTTRQKSGLI